MTLNEAMHPGEFIISEANGHQSREVITAKSGEVWVAGQVLGKISVGGKYVAHDDSASDGSEVAFAISYAAVDASDADTPAVVVARNVEVNGDLLTWINGDDVSEGTGELAAVGIIVRSTLD